VHAQSEEKNDDSKYNFYEKLEQVFYHFPRYHTKTALGDYIQKWGEIIFSNCHLGIRAYITALMIIVLE
jgi:hypothetical protein